jgi:hypothetical protein
MNPQVIFPDVEKVLVAGLKAALKERKELCTHGVEISTIKPAPDKKPYPKRIIVIRGDGGPELDDVRKIERVGVNIWADNYADASDLARITEALMKQLTGAEIKKVEIILSPVRVDEEGPQEHRYLTLEVTTKGTPL